MSLSIYTERSEVPGDMRVVDYNDSYFDGVLLQRDDLSRLVLQTVDLVQVYTDKAYIGRDSELGYLNKSYLSTGCKTLLNIIASPDVCFDICECGSNALQFLSLLKIGHVFWKRPVINYMYSSSCDIIIHGKHFTNSDNFMDYISMRGDTNEE